MSSTLTIGRLASTAGVSVETIRYYERRGIIDQPPKPVQGYRAYSEDTLNNILFIKRAQALGFSLDEITDLLSLGTGHCKEVQALAEGKLQGVRAKISDLHRLETVLDELLNLCKTNRGEACCPIVESLLPGQESNS